MRNSLRPASVQRFSLRLLVLACPLLGGCMTAGPDYKCPTVGTPTNWSTKVDGVITNGQFDPAALGQWWRVFGDSVLTDLVASAQRNNLDVKQAEARLRKARAQRQLAGAEQWPAVSLNASGSRSRSSEQMGAGSSATMSSYANSLDASW